jgi:hypothetical protein
MGDNLARERTQPRSTLAVPAAARRPQPEAEAEEETEATTVAGDDFDPLPLPGSPYKAYALARNQPEITLHVLFQDGHWRGFAWSDYAGVDMVPADSPGAGPVLVVRFAGLEPTLLLIAGRNLGKLHACIGRNRVVWIREQPSKRGFEAIGAKGEPVEVITRIDVSRWKPAREEDEG